MGGGGVTFFFDFERESAALFERFLTVWRVVSLVFC